MTLLDHLSASVSDAAIVRPGDPEWDALRATFNVLEDQQPEAIALPADEAQVVRALEFARARGWRVAAQATGHNAGPLRDLAGVMILNTSRLTGVHIDPEARRVRVGAATRWRDVVPALSDLGLAALHGSSPDVGIVGYSLGGGIGWLARLHGMQTNAVTAIEVVTADGHVLRVDPHHEPDLFWALRGGNGNFGIVTAIEFRVFPLPALYSGAMIFPVERGREVLRAWHGILPNLPEATTTWAVVLKVPPLPDIPAALRGRSIVVVMGAHVSDEEDGADLFAPVRDLGPEIDTFASQAPLALADLAMDPRDPLPYRSITALVDDLDPRVLDELLERAGAPEAPWGLTQLRHIGGALARVPEGAGARATLPGRIAVYVNSVVTSPESDADVRAMQDAIGTLIAPHTVGWYPNFVEQQVDAHAFFDDDTWDRLRAVKALYDPEDLFLGNHRIPPARA